MLLASCSSDDDDAASGDTSGANEGSTTSHNAPLSGNAAEICGAYADRIETCGEEFHWAPFYAAQGYGYCASDLGAAANLGSECTTAHEDYYACLSGLECAAFEDVSIACSEQKDAMAIVCSGGGAESTSSSTG